MALGTEPLIRFKNYPKANITLDGGGKTPYDHYRDAFLKGKNASDPKVQTAASDYAADAVSRIANDQVHGKSVNLGARVTSETREIGRPSITDRIKRIRDALRNL